MNLTALIPWPYRVLALALLLAAFGGWCWLKGDQHGEAKLVTYQAAEQRESLKLLQDTILRSRQLQAQKDKALDEAAKRETKLRADARATADDLAGLRLDLQQSRELVSRASVDSLRARVSALTDVFEDCARRYSALAETAGGHASDSLTLQQAWPREPAQ